MKKLLLAAAVLGVTGIMTAGEVLPKIEDVDKYMTIKEPDESGLVWYKPDVAEDSPFKLIGFYWYGKDHIYNRLPQGIDRKTYMRYEEYGRDYYPIEHMQKLVGMYDVPVESLLDDYNLFLYHDQGQQIRERRLSQKLTQKAYAANLGVSLDKLKNWEENRVRMFKSTWKKYFR